MSHASPQRAAQVWAVAALCLVGLIGAPSLAWAQKADGYECDYTAGFDCTKAATPMEKALCRSPEARMIDCFLGYAYRDAQRGLRKQDQKQQLLNDQRAWLRQREERCGTNASCLEQVTRSRFADLVRRYRLEGPMYEGD